VLGKEGINTIFLNRWPMMTKNNIYTYYRFHHQLIESKSYSPWYNWKYQSHGVKHQSFSLALYHWLSHYLCYYSLILRARQRRNKYYFFKSLANDDKKQYIYLLLDHIYHKQMQTKPTPYFMERHNDTVKSSMACWCSKEQISSSTHRK
jgi:hypothetical protein